MTNYEKYFGTQKRAATTLFALDPKYRCTLESGKRVMTDRFSGKTIWKHDVDRALSWIDWLKEEAEPV